MQQYLAQRNQAEQQRRAALTAIGPQVTVSSAYNFANQLSNSTGFANGYYPQGTASWSLYNGGAARASAKQQEANIAIAETNFANQRNQIRFNMEQAYTNLQANFRNIQISEIGLVKAREARVIMSPQPESNREAATDVINVAEAHWLLFDAAALVTIFAVS